MKGNTTANLSNQRKRTRKSDTPKKIVQSKNESLLNTLRKDLSDSDRETKHDITLRLSVSEGEDKISNVTDEKVIGFEKLGKSTSDVQAYTLIKRLRDGTFF